MANGIKVIYSNVDILSKNKKQELEILIEDLKPQIIALTEAYPKHKVLDIDTTIYNIKDYDLFHNSTENNRGILIYIAKSLDPTSVEITTQYKEVVGCKIKLKGKDSLDIFTIYRSPTHPTDPDILDTLFREICHNTSHVLILGDFNLKEINWVNLSTTIVNENHPANKFLETIRDNYLYQHVNKPTRYRDGQVPSLLDLVMTNEEGMIEDMQFLPGLGKSDHCVIVFDFIAYTPNVETVHSTVADPEGPLPGGGA